MVDIFYKKFRKDVIYRKAEEVVINQYKNILPNNLLEFWKEEGWNGYYNGLFWVVNPNEYKDILEDWIGHTDLYKNDTFTVFARTAFGKMYVWSLKKRDYFTLNPQFGTLFDFNDNYPNPNEEDDSKLTIESFFLNSDIEDYDYYDDNEDGLFHKSFKKLGQLKENEMYSFEPALILGGSDKLENVKKVSIIPQLYLLSELFKEEIQSYESNIDIDKLVEEHFQEKEEQNTKSISLFNKFKNFFKRD